MPALTEPARATGVVTRRQHCVLCGAEQCDPVGSGVDFEYGTCPDEFTFVRCRGCGHHYLRDVPVPAELGRIYPADYGNYEAGRSQALTFRVKAWLDRRWLRRLARLAPAPHSLLDVGCADGRTLDLCRATFPAIERLEGVEISEGAARAARDRGHRVSIGSIDDLELPEAAYDWIFLQQVIEHVYAPDRVCRRLARALRPGGLVVFETPTSDCLDFRLFRRRYWGGYHFPRHFNLFCERSLRALGEREGLEWVETGYRPQPIHWVWTAHHALRERGWPAAIHERFHIRNAPLMACCTGLELAAGLVSGRMSNLRLVMRRPAQPA